MIALYALVAAVHASAPMTLVPRTSTAKRMSTVVSTKGAPITTAEFVAAILDCEHYPMSASYMGVKALLECRTLEKRSDGYTVVYQRTGGNALVGSRHYVIAIKVTEQSDTRARIEWDLVTHAGGGSTPFVGPYAATLNAQEDPVYTPFNTGSWLYDKAAGSVTYSAQSDPGGTVPGWLVSQDAVMAFPLELLKVKWGVTP
ncbi:MAG: hypothetical protein Q8P18_32320 [Pseudomonadota bacterium]|nr:hypothetical protein [Pseudomonadota bacterium]